MTQQGVALPSSAKPPSPVVPRSSLHPPYQAGTPTQRSAKRGRGWPPLIPHHCSLSSLVALTGYMDLSAEWNSSVHSNQILVARWCRASHPGHFCVHGGLTSSHSLRPLFGPSHGSLQKGGVPTTVATCPFIHPGSPPIFLPRHNGWQLKSDPPTDCPPQDRAANGALWQVTNTFNKIHLCVYFLKGSRSVALFRGFVQVLSSTCQCNEVCGDQVVFVRSVFCKIHLWHEGEKEYLGWYIWLCLCVIGWNQQQEVASSG